MTSGVFGLLGTEAAFLAASALIGSGPASLLRGHAPRAVRMAFAPMLGVAVGTCVFATTTWFFTTASTFWIIPLLAVLSVAFALRRGRSTEERPWRALAQCALVVAVVLTPLTAVMLEQGSSGPVAFQVFDAADYVSLQDGMQVQSLEAARTSPAAGWNLVENLYASLAGTAQETEISPFAANLENLLGIGATEGQAGFLIALIAIGGLGLFGAICVVLRRQTWWAVFGGCLLSGPFFAQLFLDGSEGAISGLVALIPLGALSVLAVRSRSRWVYLLPVVLLSALYNFYPVFLSAVGATLAVALVAMAVKSGAVRGREWGMIGRGIGCLALLFAASIVLNPIGFARAAAIWDHIFGTSFGGLGFPVYHLPLDMLPGWLFQSTDFYSFATGPTSPGPIASWIVPLIVVAVSIPVLRRYPTAWLVVPAVLVVIVSAHHQVASVSNSCSYCEDRSLLPMGVLVAFVVGAGVAALALNHRVVASAVIVVTSVFVATSAYNALNSYSAGTYFTPTTLRQVVDHAPVNGSIVDLEAFDAGPRAPGEFPLAYDVVWEHTQGHLSAPADVQGDSGLAYVYVHPLSAIVGEIYNPTYRYVLTRIPNVETARKVLFEAGGVALEQRVQSLDVTVDGGIGVQSAADPDGNAYVESAVKFVVAGRAAAPTVRFSFALPPQLNSSELAALGAVGTLHSIGATPDAVLTGCVPTTVVARVASVYAPHGVAGIHTATVAVPGAIGIRLTSMYAQAKACP
jgi:hypothetical protein